VSRSKGQAVSARLDPVTFEVLKNSFVNTVDRMAEQILRTCHSFVFYCRDFSCALCDRDGNTVAQGTQDIAAHVGTLHLTLKAVIAAFAGDINPGDVFAVNDPFAGATHFPDVRVIRPVFAGEELIAFTQANGHWADIGGAVPGSENVNARDYFADGLRIPPVRVWSEGRMQEDLVRLITSNTRAPEDALGDLRAQAEATLAGEREIQRLLGKYGRETVLVAFAEVQDYVERVTRARLRSLPDGSWASEDYMDRDPEAAEGLVPIKVRMTIAGEEIEFDLTGTHPAVASNFNCGFGGGFSAVIGGLKMFFPDVPLNSGFYRPVSAILPAGTVVNAQPPAAVSGYYMPYEKVANTIVEMLSALVPERAMACSFNMEYLEVAGRDRRLPGRPFFMWYDWNVGGWGARHDRDGANASSTLFGAGLATQPVEGQERLSPVVITEYELLADSGGPGRLRGGLGTRKSARLTDGEEMVVAYVSDRERSIAWGIAGGLPSNPMGVSCRQDGVERFLGGAFVDLPIGSGATFSRPSSGGGGLGDPLTRDPRAVLEDVIEGYVSVERALGDYGVVVVALDEELAEYRVDEERTRAAREQQRAARRGRLAEDPVAIAARYRAHELDALDVVRHHGVILDWESGELLERTTATFRAMVERRAVAYWEE
jgi:N-methylhydantoinase B